MRQFDYSGLPEKLLTPEICNLLSAIHEYRGKQALFITAKKDVLQTLLEIAVIRSTDSSNRIEGVLTSDDRLKELVEQRAEPISRNEREIAGYRDVLAAIHENYEYIPVTPNTVLQLHRDLYSFQPAGIGGHWKNSDNFIAETDTIGRKHIRFTPTPAVETPDAMECLCRAYSDAVQHEVYDPVLLAALFIFDFLCIHPFNDGNGRMSRLLTLLLLYRSGYIVGKYISLEMLIEKSKQTYYEALQKSSTHWNSAKNDYIPFVRFFLGMVIKAYREFEDRVTHVSTGKTTKADRIRLVFESRLGKISKADIAEQCPDISISMIERTLKELLDAGIIEKVGSGKRTAYVKR
ncbi:MAG: Fic family protein [Victivallaceae bacterium]|nr:Fic family protein [Victivallaceae bacterium]